jgi:hypothetical protein
MTKTLIKNTVNHTIPVIFVGVEMFKTTSCELLTACVHGHALSINFRSTHSFVCLCTRLCK